MAAPQKLKIGAKGGGGGEADESSVRWLISYSDFMMQLVCLFILLYSVSSLDPSKLAALVKGYREYVGVTPQTTVPEETEGESLAVMDRPLVGGKAGYADVSDRLKFKFKEVPEGWRVDFDDPLFEPGSFQLSPDAKILLDEAAKTLRTYVGVLYIFGLASGEADAIEGDALRLAQARAESVITHLARKDAAHPMDPRMMVAAGLPSAEVSEARRVTLILRVR